MTKPLLKLEDDLKPEDGVEQTVAGQSDIEAMSKMIATGTDSICGIPIQETTETRVYRFRKDRVPKNKTYSCSSKQIETRQLRKRIASRPGKKFTPLKADTHEYLSGNLSVISTPWQVSRNFVAVGDDMLCRVYITNQEVGGKTVSLGRHSIKVLGFKDVKNDVTFTDFEDVLTQGGVLQRLGCLLKEMVAIGSVGNIALVARDPDVNFTGQSMMLSIEACFRNFDPSYVYTGDANPALEWLPSDPLTTEDLAAKI